MARAPALARYLGPDKRRKPDAASHDRKFKNLILDCIDIYADLTDNERERYRQSIWRRARPWNESGQRSETRDACLGSQSQSASPGRKESMTPELVGIVTVGVGMVTVGAALAGLTLTLLLSLGREVGGLRSELRNELAREAGGLRSELGELRSEMHRGFVGLEGRMAHVETILQIAFPNLQVAETASPQDDGDDT